MPVGPTPLRLLFATVLAATMLVPGAYADDDAEAAFDAKVEAAVVRGLDWLRAQQDAEGTFPSTRKPPFDSWPTYTIGRTALVALAFIQCGGALDDPTFVRALDVLKRRHREVLQGSAQRHAATYSVALMLMVLHELYVARPLWLDDEGNPAPGRSAPGPGNPLGMPLWARAMHRTLATWLVDTRSKDGLFGYPTSSHEISEAALAHLSKKQRKQLREIPRSDMSNTQYGLLGLWAASRLGHEVDTRTLRKIADLLLRSQAQTGAKVQRRFDPDGDGAPGDDRYGGPTDRVRGFGYGTSEWGMNAGVRRDTASMTAGGLSSLLVVKAMLAEAEVTDGPLISKLEQGIWDAVAWLATHFEPDHNAVVSDWSKADKDDRKLQEAADALGGMERGWLHYYLYGLERALVIAGKRYLGERDWYREGAGHLIGTQAEDGAWRVVGKAIPLEPGVVVPVTEIPGMTLPDTCFALLFLRRATIRPRTALLRTRRAAPK